MELGSSMSLRPETKASVGISLIMYRRKRWGWYRGRQGRRVLRDIGRR
jgi:hypothetical protein